VFNFAQGVMVLFAALTLVGCSSAARPSSRPRPDHRLMVGWPSRSSGRAATARQSTADHPFMATIGLNFFLEVRGDGVGRQLKKARRRIPDHSFVVRGVQINSLELTAR